MRVNRSARLAGPVVLAVALMASATSCSSATGGSGAGSDAAPSTQSTPVAPASTGRSTNTPPPSTGPSTPAPSTPVSPPSKTKPVIAAPAIPLQTKTVTGIKTTYVVKIWVRKQDPSCFQHAYGQPVIQYLIKHPCTGLTRILGTTTVNGRAVGFAQSSLGFTGVAPPVYQVAGDFRTLVTENGTGNLKDLLREGFRLPSGPTAVPDPDAFNATAQDSGVAVVDAWYLDGPTPANDKALVQMAQDFFLQV